MLLPTHYIHLTDDSQNNNTMKFVIKYQLSSLQYCLNIDTEVFGQNHCVISCCCPACIYEVLLIFKFKFKFSINKIIRSGPVHGWMWFQCGLFPCRWHSIQRILSASRLQIHNVSSFLQYSFYNYCKCSCGICLSVRNRACQALNIHIISIWWVNLVRLYTIVTVCTESQFNKKLCCSRVLVSFISIDLSLLLSSAVCL